jgi:ribokinase
MTRVAVVGHVEWVDFVEVDRFPRPGTVVHAPGSFARAGGGGGVVVGVLADLEDVEVEFFVALGRDAAGEATVAQLTERGAVLHVAWRDQPTRRAVTLLEDDGERTIITIGERLEPLGSDELPWERLADCAGVYFTAGDASALKRACATAVVVASPRARTSLGSPGPTIDAIVFSEHDPDEAAWAERTASRARLLVATEGEHGGRWWGASSGRWEAAPLPGPPLDAYGCGDSFAGGFMVGLARGQSVADAAAFGARLGALALVRRGAP